MELHHELKEMIGGHGSGLLEDATTSRGAIDDAATFRGALDDYFPEGRIPAGEINLLVDAVRLGALSSLVRMVDWGGDPAASVESAASAFARDRGGLPYPAAAWACAVLGYAVGRVPEHVVRRFPPMSADQLWSHPSPPPTMAPPPPPPPADATTAPVDRTMWSPYGDSFGAGAEATVAGAPRYAAPPPYAQGTRSAPLLPPRRRGGRVALAVVAAVLAAAAGGGVVLALSQEGDDQRAGATAGARDRTEAPPSTPASSPTEPAPTTPATSSTPPEPVRSADPREPAPDVPGLPVTRLDQPLCNDAYVVMLAKGFGTSDGSKHTVAQKYFGRAGEWDVDPSDLRYLSNRGSCLGGRPGADPPGLPPTYQVYVGPYDSAADACRTREVVGDPRAWIRRLGTEGPLGDYCFCQDTPAELDAQTATLQESAEYGVVAEVQQLFLYSDRKLFTSYNPGMLIGGRMQSFHEDLQAFQLDRGLSGTGDFNVATWEEIQALAQCG
ncbi:hypothetical protein [Nocardioides sp. MH1]|uniref:hypothetical protein n=1 Tax=Nocardioides sp. MH1 TaxID=3242490 RepID=UPI0035212810